MAAIPDVRRFTALDMHGGAGSLRRRRIIRAEFVLGCVVALAFGAFLLARGVGLVGLWILGVGVNYFPLAVYAVVLFPDDRIERELAGVDLGPRCAGPPAHSSPCSFRFSSASSR
jgi:hypothetical protein